MGSRMSLIESTTPYAYASHKTGTRDDAGRVQRRILSSHPKGCVNNKSIIFMTPPIEIAKRQIETNSYDLKELFDSVFRQMYPEKHCQEVLPMLISRIRVNKRLKRYLTAHRIIESSSGTYSYFEYNPNLFSLHKTQKEKFGSTFTPEELVKLVSDGVSKHFAYACINYDKVSRMHLDNPELAALLDRI
jgi:hypothetical protein